MRWKNREIIGCQLSDGAYIDLKRQKVTFPDNTQIFFGEKEYNLFRLGDNKLFTDKTFTVTKFVERGKFRRIERNENFVATKGHRIRTDGKNRIVEEGVTLSDSQKLNIKFNYSSDGASVSFSDGTKLNVDDGKFKISHNGVELNFVNRYSFINSYNSNVAKVSLKKSGFER